MLTLIKTNVQTKDKPNLHTLYRNAFFRTVKYLNDNQNDRQKLKQLIFYGVRFINMMDETQAKSEAESNFQFIAIIRALISELTPAELITIFPVEKTYGGLESVFKDYFYTMEELHKIGLNKNIGDKIMDLLWDYQNDDIRLFLMNSISIANDLRKLNGLKDINEEWCENNDIPMYSVHKDSTGHEYVQDISTGQTTKVKHKVPRYIRRVK